MGIIKGGIESGQTPKLIKVKATNEFKKYRCQVLGLDKKDYRTLQANKDVAIPIEIYKKYRIVFKEVKDGHKRNSIHTEGR